MKRIKKILVVLASAIAVVCLAVGLAGCASDVDGNTYTFSSVSITVSSEYSEEISSVEIAEYEADMAAEMEGVTISFADGVATLTQGDDSDTYSYSQDGSTITLYDEDDEGTQVEVVTFTVSGSSLVWERSYSGITWKFTFKKS